MQIEIFFSEISANIYIDISCRLSPNGTICIKCQSLLPGKNKKNIINLSSAEIVHRVVKVKDTLQGDVTFIL